VKPSVYIETTISSYLTARPSRDLIVAANQQITKDWWERRKEHFNLFISEFVIEEVSAGDKEAAKERLKLLRAIPLLDAIPEVGELAKILLKNKIIPAKASQDAVHIATAAVHGIDLLMTWNCKHIANATIFASIRSICEKQGYDCPEICTPQELMED